MILAYRFCFAYRSPYNPHIQNFVSFHVFPFSVRVKTNKILLEITLMRCDGQAAGKEYVKEEKEDRRRLRRTKDGEADAGPNVRRGK